jgi:hypothetical protein
MLALHKDYFIESPQQFYEVSFYYFYFTGKKTEALSSLQLNQGYTVKLHKENLT